MHPVRGIGDLFSFKSRASCQSKRSSTPMTSTPACGPTYSAMGDTSDERTVERRRRRKRKVVAIVGTGLAGLHAAHLLSESAALRDEYDVHLFERSERIGLDGNSISVEGRRIDVPLRSFNAGYYPELMKLYRKLDVPFRRNNFTFSFATMPQDHSNSPSPFLLYNGHSGLRGISVPFRAQQSVRSIRKLFDYARFVILLAASYLYLLVIALFHYSLGHLHDPANRLSNEPLQVWLALHTRLMSTTFVEAVLIPLFSAMTTSALGEVGRIPTAEVLLYIATTFLRNHYTVDGGVKQVQGRLQSTIPVGNIHLSTSVEQVVFAKDTEGGCDGKIIEGRIGKCKLSTISTESQERKEYGPFDHVIFATPATHSASALDNCSKSLDGLPSSVSSSRSAVDIKLQRIQAQLRQVRYESSTVTNHTDQSLMPPPPQDWRDLNLVTCAPSDEEETASLTSNKGKKREQTHTMATHACHQLQDGRFVFQTTNSLYPPRPASILSTSTFPRALTVPKKQIQGLYTWKKRDNGLFGTGILPTWSLTLGDLQRTTKDGHNLGLWFCGSYCQGIPLLEGCVTSSALVVAEIMQQDGIAVPEDTSSL